MYLIVYPAGYGTGKGTHVSILVYLMKGDYDDELNWPFTAEVVVDILNWKGDHNHYRAVFEFNEDCPDEARARVNNFSNKALSGHGNPKVIEISTLMSCSSDPQYNLGRLFVY